MATVDLTGPGLGEGDDDDEDRSREVLVFLGFFFLEDLMVLPDPVAELTATAAVMDTDSTACSTAEEEGEAWS